MTQLEPTCVPPQPEEIHARHAKLQAGMIEQGLDYYVFDDHYNVFYLTNFANYPHERPFILVMPANGDPIFVMPKLEEPHVRARGVGRLEFAPYREFPAPAGEQWSDQLQEVIASGSKVGIEPNCPFNISQAIPGTIVSTDLIDDLRSIKSDYEIARIRYCSDILSVGHGELLRMAKPGAMPIEIHSALSRMMMGKLIQDLPSTNILASQFNAATQPPILSDDPHNFTDLFTPLVEGGPHVTVVQGKANGYGAEVERTFFIGHVPEAAKRPFDVMIEARQMVFDLAIPGNAMGEVDAKVNEHFIRNGYGENLLHRTGHSFGVSDHEGPFLAEGDDHVIKPNMVFSFEPGIYLRGTGGFRFSDTVVTTLDGNRMLTSAPDTLEGLTLPLLISPTLMVQFEC